MYFEYKYFLFSQEQYTRPERKARKKKKKRDNQGREITKETIGRNGQRERKEKRN